LQNSELPASLGPYHVLEPIGQGLGGMGELFLCYDPSLDRKVVVKRVPLGANEEIIQRFHREAQLLSGVAHPGYPQVYRFWTLDGRPTLAMQFIDGVTLRELMDLRKTIPADVMLLVAQTVAEALRHAHLHGIIHRDVKPANIMITHSGQVFLLDFGVARMEVNSELTIPGSVVGTTSYMAPEQARGETVGPPADLFSLGLLSYEAISGHHPFRKDGPEATLSSILTDSVKPLWALTPRAGRKLSRLLADCLQKKAAKRPQNGMEFLQRLDGLLAGKSSDREFFLASYMEAVRLNKPFVSELPRRSVSGWTWLVGGVVGSLLILLAVYLVLHGGAL
jgi:eukaryotic-like serine/threonine-protein kinase